MEFHKYSYFCVIRTFCKLMPNCLFFFLKIITSCKCQAFLKNQILICYSIISTNVIRLSNFEHLFPSSIQHTFHISVYFFEVEFLGLSLPVFLISQSLFEVFLSWLGFAPPTNLISFCHF